MEYKNNARVIESNEIPITNEVRPHLKNGSKHILSEIRLLHSQELNIKYVTQNIECGDANYNKIEDIDNIEELSSDETSQAKDAENLGKIKIVMEKEDLSYLNQAKVLEHLIVALEKIKNKTISSNAIFLENILFVDKNLKSISNAIKKHLSAQPYTSNISD